MKFPILILAIFGFTFNQIAQINASTTTTAFDHLADVNSEWKHHRNEAPLEKLSFESDIERISLHLKLVTASLQKNTADNLTASQRENRLELIKILDGYANAKVFPTNTNHSERTPYFIDDFNVYCAVGYLIQASGHDALARQIHDEQNFDYIRDIKTPGVETWAMEHGFTLDELAWIQPGYQAAGTYTTVGTGTNGGVLAMCKDPNVNKIYMVGDFTGFAGWSSCSNIGYIENDVLYCLGGGLEGTFTDVFMHGADVVVTGRVSTGGNFYSYAIFHTATNLWSVHNIPGREGLFTKTGISGGNDFDLQFALYNNQGAGEHEVWTLKNGVWNIEATFAGTVYSIAKSESELVYAGSFNGVTVHLQGGDIPFSTQNALRHEMGTDNWYTISGQIADIVYKVKWVNDNFFFAGSAISHIDAPYNSFSVMHADSAAAIYSNGIYSSGQSDRVVFYDFEASSDSSVVVCGDFDAGWMYFGSGVATLYYTNFNSTVGQGYPYSASYEYAHGTTNGEIPKALELKNTALYISGEMNILKNIAKFDLPVGLTTVENYSWSVYPNPVANELHVESELPFSTFEILDLTGKQVASSNGKSAEISSLLAGTYIVRVYFENGEVVQTKIVKQ